jgi:hypothetical protein
MILVNSNVWRVREIAASFVACTLHSAVGFACSWQGGFSRDGYVAACSSDRRNHPALAGRKLMKQIKESRVC